MDVNKYRMMPELRGLLHTVTWKVKYDDLSTLISKHTSSLSQFRLPSVAMSLRLRVTRKPSTSGSSGWPGAKAASTWSKQIIVVLSHVWFHLVAPSNDFPLDGCLQPNEEMLLRGFVSGRIPNATCHYLTCKVWKSLLFALLLIKDRFYPYYKKTKTCNPIIIIVRSNISFLASIFNVLKDLSG